jgi:predicted metalloendopeptidase
MPIRRAVAAVVLITALTDPAVRAQTAATPERTKPLRSLDVTALDKTADPCTDFYAFACGGWRANNPVPGDKARWGRFDELREFNLYTLKDILEDAAKPVDTRTPIEKQVGDFYASCMDTSAIDAAGLKPIAPDLEQVTATASKEDLIRVMGALRRDGMSTLFAFGVGPALKDSTQTLMNVDQGGIGLPERDYYLKDDPKNVETREKYVAHMARMFTLAGDSADAAAARAKSVLALETRLAAAQLDRVARRNPTNRDHRMTLAGLKSLTPGFDIAAYIGAAEAPAFSDVNVGWPDFFKALDTTWRETPLDDLKSYVRWHVLNAAAAGLAAPFEQEHFDFFSRYLRGIKEQPPRWKTCVGVVDANLGEALGQLYVRKAFGAESKARMIQLVDALTVALEQDITTLDWMTPETKTKAIEKLKKLGKGKIGYPEKWRDYSSVTITRDDFLGNSRRADRFEVKRNYDKLGKPVDKTEWSMTPPTVNAYYSPQFAEIVFPAGILQPPFFDVKIDDAVNFGAIGAVIGHELSHGFDDSGRKFDGDGNLKDWWTDADAKAFEERAACIADQYSGYSPVNDPKTGKPAFLNGKLTLGENIGDNGGVRIAFMALMNTLKGRDRAVIDGFTPEQRLFLGFAQVWCQNSTEADALQRVFTDPHSSGRFRTNGTVSNMPEFQGAFSCKTGAAMAPEKRCRVW